MNATIFKMKAHLLMSFHFENLPPTALFAPQMRKHFVSFLMRPKCSHPSTHPIIGLSVSSSVHPSIYQHIDLSTHVYFFIDLPISLPRLFSVDRPIHLPSPHSSTHSFSSSVSFMGKTCRVLSAARRASAVKMLDTKSDQNALWSSSVPLWKHG